MKSKTKDVVVLSLLALVGWQVAVRWNEIPKDVIKACGMMTKADLRKAYSMALERKLSFEAVCGHRNTSKTCSECYRAIRGSVSIHHRVVHLEEVARLEAIATQRLRDEKAREAKRIRDEEAREAKRIRDEKAREAKRIRDEESPEAKRIREVEEAKRLEAFEKAIRAMSRGES